MFRFTMDNTVEVNASEEQLAHAGIARDDDFAGRLRETDDVTDDETVFLAERDVDALDEAVAFVQGVFFHPPGRVWLGADEHAVTDAVLARVPKPGAEG